MEYVNNRQVHENVVIVVVVVVIIVINCVVCVMVFIMTSVIVLYNSIRH